LDFAIEPAVSDGNEARIPPAHGAGSVPDFLKGFDGPHRAGTVPGFLSYPIVRGLSPSFCL